MILVTGGTGFLGAYIIKNLIEKGHAVRAIRRSAVLPFFIPPDILQKVEWVSGDVLDMVSLDDAMKGIQTIIHSAAIVSFTRDMRSLMYQVNVEGTANVVNAALENRVERLIHISSIAALGRTTHEETVNEEKKWENNKNNTHYAISKHEAEMHVYRGFAEGLEGLILNPSTILGFGNWHLSSCSIFRNAYREFPWYTQGINGFVGVEDVAEVCERLMVSGYTQRKFIVNAENRKFRELFDMIADGFNRKRPYREASPFIGELAWRFEKLKSLLTGKKPLLTRETAKVAHSRTSFSNEALKEALPQFQFTPLEEVIKNACEKYRNALETGVLTL
jgi:dihydroflavonol-4-reductase